MPRCLTLARFVGVITMLADICISDFAQILVYEAFALCSV